MDGRQHLHHHRQLAMNASGHDATAPAHHISQRFPHPRDAYIQSQGGGIDVSAISASVQRYIPSSAPSSSSSSAHLIGSTATSSSHLFPSPSNIALPPGVDPATVDFRTFYSYNPSEVKHRKRTSRGQLKILEETFKVETKPNAALRKSLASQLEMSPRGVQVWFQNRRAKEKTLAKKLLSGDRRNTSTLGLSFSSSTGNGNEGNNSNGDASSLTASGSTSAPESPSNDPDARNLGGDGNFNQSAARVICGVNANVDLDLDVVSEEGRESELAEGIIATYGASTNRDLVTAVGTTPSPSSTTSDLASASRVSLPASASCSPPTSLLAPSPEDKTTRRGAGSHHQSPAVKQNGEDSDDARRDSANGDGGASMSRTSWHGSSGRTPTMMPSVLPSQDASNGTHFADHHHGELADVRLPANNDLRRPSLPTHLSLDGLGHLREANGHHSGRTSATHHGAAQNENTDGLNALAPRPMKGLQSRVYDPTASRRLSLDRLASHPYASVALQANGAVYGQQGMYRRASAFAGSGHFNVGYGRGIRHGHGAQFASERYQHWHQQRRPLGSEFATIGEVRTPQAGAVGLPVENQYEMMERAPQEDGQPEFLRRGSLPGDPFIESPQQQFSENSQQQVFPREGHVYALPRDYAPPTNGPLPAADFQFGTGTGNFATAADGADESTVNAGMRSQTEASTSLDNYTFPQGSSAASSTIHTPQNEEIPPHATAVPLCNPFNAPRFGSIASIASEISEYGSSSETSISTNASVGNGPTFMQGDPMSAGSGPRRGSVLDVNGFDYNARRPSYTGQIADMFSNLDVHNGSRSSLSHEGAPPNFSSAMNYSRSSELAFALSPRKESCAGASSAQSSVGSADHSPNDMDVNGVSFSSSSNTSSDRQPMSDQEPLVFNYSMGISAASSASSLNVGTSTQLARNPHVGGHMHHSSLGLQIPADDFLCSDIEEVSGTGHYSPVSAPARGGAGSVYGFEFAHTGSGSSSLLNIPHSQHPLSQSTVPMYAHQQSLSQENQADVYMKMQDDSIPSQSMPFQGQRVSSDSLTQHRPFYN